MYHNLLFPVLPPQKLQPCTLYLFFLLDIQECFNDSIVSYSILFYAVSPGRSRVTVHHSAYCNHVFFEAAEKLFDLFTQLHIFKRVELLKQGVDIKDVKAYKFIILVLFTLNYPNLCTKRGSFAIMSTYSVIASPHFQTRQWISWSLVLSCRQAVHEHQT